MPDKRYTKVEEEVMQILDRLESEKPAPARPNLRLVESRSASKRRFRRPKLQISQRLSGKPWMWIAIALGLAVAAVMLRDVSSNLALLVAILSICAFFAPLFV